MVTSEVLESGRCVCLYCSGFGASAGSCTLRLFYALVGVVLICGSNGESFVKETRFAGGYYALGGTVAVDVISTAATWRRAS